MSMTCTVIYDTIRIIPNRTNAILKTNLNQNHRIHPGQNNVKCTVP